MKEELKKSIQNPDYLCLAGSRLYGTFIETSDRDFRGFVLPSFEYLISVKKFEYADLGGDHKIYSLRRFLELILYSDPLLTECLFAPQDKIVRITEVGKEILNLRSDLISNRIYNRILGYSCSEWRKAMGLKYIIDKRTRTENETINDIRNIFKLEKEDMDDVLGILLKNKERKLILSVPSFGAKRKKEYDDYGFCVSSASHSIRLIGELEELLLTGNITFPRPNADILKSIRYGKYKKEEVNKIYEETRIKAKEARKNSVLSSTPNFKKVWSVYKEIVKKFIRE